MKNILVKALLFLLVLGFTGHALGQADLAISNYQTGNMYYSQKDYVKAMRYFNLTIDIDPRFWQAYQGLGNCYYAKGKLGKAAANYQMALHLNPQNPTLKAFVDTLRAQIAATQTQNNTEEDEDQAAEILHEYFESYFELDPGVGITLFSGFSGLQFGGGFNGFYMVSPKLGIGAMIHYNYFSESGKSTGYYLNNQDTIGSYTETDSLTGGSLEFMPAIKYVFWKNWITPYMVLGMGIDLLSAEGSTNYNYKDGNPQNYIPTSDSTGAAVFFMGAGGVGVQCLINENMNVFLETRLSVIFTNNNNVNNSESSYLPVEAGLGFKL